MVLAIPVSLIAFAVAVVICTTNIKEVLIVAVVTLIIVLIIEITNEGVYNIIANIPHSILIIVLSIAAGSTIGISLYKMMPRTIALTIGVFFGGIVSSIIYSLQLML